MRWNLEVVKQGRDALSRVERTILKRTVLKRRAGWEAVSDRQLGLG